MQKELYDELISSIPEKFREDIIYEIESNHFDINGLTLENFIISCKWVLDSKKLHLRRIIHNLSKESIDKKGAEISELEDFINKIAK